jgi:uncharacterized membrane protein
MKNTLRALITLLTLSSTVYAAGTTGTGGGNLLLTLFIGFFALIVVFQLVPAVLLFIGMVKGLTSKETKEAKSSH